MKQIKVIFAIFLLCLMITGVACADISVADLQSQLTQFKASIDVKSQQGIDTSAAAQKYSEASTAIQSANTATSTTTQQSYLNQARTALQDGQNALDRTSSQKVITDAQKPIDQTDDLITYFKVNRGLSNDPRLKPIIYARDSAADLISEANDLLSRAQTADDFSKVRDKALQASDKGQEAYNDALALRKDIGDTVVIPQSPAIKPNPTVYIVTQLPPTQRTSMPSVTVNTVYNPVIPNPTTYSVVQTPQVTFNLIPVASNNQQQETINQLKQQNALLAEQNQKLQNQGDIFQNILNAISNFFTGIGSIMGNNYAGNYIAQSSSGQIALTLNPDGTFYMGSNSVGTSGKYSVYKNIITITPSFGNMGLATQLTASGDTLTIMGTDGQQIVFVKQ